jgi:ABC-type phosphate/phosphonate transport system substrate-binding protein
METFNNPAALPWYDFPATRQSLDAVWRDARARLQSRGIAQLPDSLERSIGYAELFAYSQLTLSQCCGLDLFHPDAAHVIPFAAPIITAYEVPPGEYYSHIVARHASNLDHPRVVINGKLSHSGHTAIRIWLHARGITDYTIFESGSHARSVDMLRRGLADLAAIDALSWAQLETSGTDGIDGLDGLDVIGTSDFAPAPPFITGKDADIPLEELIDALDAAFKRHGQRIGITGVIAASRSDYTTVSTSAAKHGILPAANASPEE